MAGTRKLTAALGMGLRLMVSNPTLRLKIVDYFKIYQILVCLLSPLALLVSLAHLLAEIVQGLRRRWVPQPLVLAEPVITALVEIVGFHLGR
ncbi:hypothetical protein AWY96_21995 [Serratia plymuthica]|nr:hypothetical protein AWY96_21995 [Serratia plymuthica]